MSNQTPLTSNSGESEWPYKGKTLIAVEETETDCLKCYLRNVPCGTDYMPVNCCLDFDDSPNVIYIEKPAAK